MHPPVPSGGYRETPPDGLTVAGHYIPGLTTVVAPRYTLGRRKFPGSLCYDPNTEKFPSGEQSKAVLSKPTSSSPNDGTASRKWSKTGELLHRLHKVRTMLFLVYTVPFQFTRKNFLSKILFWRLPRSLQLRRKGPRPCGTPVRYRIASFEIQNQLWRGRGWQTGWSRLAGSIHRRAGGAPVEIPGTKQGLIGKRLRFAFIN